MRGGKFARGFKGQRQKWFAFRFHGEDAEVDLAAHPPVEFDAWRWARLDEVAAWSCRSSGRPTSR
jgi:putative (di)nucleoside polyphosphate hydrolase